MSDRTSATDCLSVPRRFLEDFVKSIQWHSGHGQPSLDRVMALTLSSEAQSYIESPAPSEPKLPIVRHINCFENCQAAVATIRETIAPSESGTLKTTGGEQSGDVGKPEDARPASVGIQMPWDGSIPSAAHQDDPAVHGFTLRDAMKGGLPPSTALVRYDDFFSLWTATRSQPSDKAQTSSPSATVSITPRTDAAHGKGRFANCVDVDFARQLEMELAEAKAAFQQEADIRTDRETVMDAMGQALGVPHEPHQTYMERLIEAATARSSTVPPSVSSAEWQHLVEMARREGFIAGQLSVAPSATTRTFAPAYPKHEADRAEWLADKIPALGDYAKEAAIYLRRYAALVPQEAVAEVVEVSDAMDSYVQRAPAKRCIVPYKPIDQLPVGTKLYAVDRRTTHG